MVMEKLGRNGKLVVAFIFMILSLVMASGCLRTGPVECGSDESCFGEALDSCSLATVTTVKKYYAFGDLNVSYVISASVKGKEDGGCVIEEKIDRLDMSGNLTGAPSRLLFVLYSIVDKPLACSTTGPVKLDLPGMNDVPGECAGAVLDLLDEAFAYEEGVPQNVTGKRIQVRESFCVGGEKVVVYIRNIALADINLSTDVQLLDAETGDAIPVAWLDFAGQEALEMLYPFQMAQFSLESQPGTLYSYDLVLEGRTYPVTVQC